jgi:hypothetical protein
MLHPFKLPFPLLAATTGTLWDLELISKLFEEHGDAGKLHKPEEIGGVVFSAYEEAPFPLQPGKEPFDEPAAFVAT